MAITVGSGPTRVLALHGRFGSARGWGFLPDLIDHDAQTWVFLDARGYGDRRDTPGEHTIAEIGADALALADELGWDRFALVGHSMGASAAQHVLAEAPHRVTHLIGISPVPASGIPFDDEQWALFSGAAADPANRRAIIDMVTGSRLSARWVDTMVQHNLDTSDATAFGAYLPSWARSDFAARIKSNPVPALAVVGAQDPAITAAIMEQTWLNPYPNSKLDIIADAGHYAMYVQTLIEDFLR